jgi:hypothetical protein
MANTSLLIATTSRSPAPQWTDEPDSYQVLAEGVWRVPTLWYALFRPEDLIEHELEDEDGRFWCYATPVVSRRRIRARLKSARDSLSKLPMDPTVWEFLLDGLADVLEEAGKQFRYVVCQWHEVADLDAKRFAKEANWMLRFFAGEPVRQVKKQFETACDFPLSKFRNPQGVSSSDYRDADWNRLDQLMGDAVERDAPWHPVRSKSKSLLGAVFDQDSQHVRQLVADGTKITDKEMLFAAFGKDPGILQSLLERGGNPSAQGRHGSCLVRAFNSRKSVEQKIGMLLDHGADVNREDPPYKVLVCCLRHGLNLAPRIIDLSNREVLESFIAWSESEVFDQYVADCDVRWADEFLGLVNDSLHG